MPRPVISDAEPNPTDAGRHPPLAPILLDLGNAHPRYAT
jgi:hypothetical protein